MANKRDPNKIKVQTWLSKEDKKALEARAKEQGYSNLAEFLAAIARGLVKLALLDALGRWLFSGDIAASLFNGFADMFSLTKTVVSLAYSMIA